MVILEFCKNSGHYSRMAAGMAQNTTLDAAHTTLRGIDTAVAVEDAEERGDRAVALRVAEISPDTTQLQQEFRTWCEVMRLERQDRTAGHGNRGGNGNGVNRNGGGNNGGGNNYSNGKGINRDGGGNNGGGNNHVNGSRGNQNGGGNNRGGNNNVNGNGRNQSGTGHSGGGGQQLG